MNNLVASLPEAFREAPIDGAIVLGSGWGESLTQAYAIATLPYAQIPEYGSSTIAGHAGKLALLECQGKRILAFFGRRHYYEGCPMEQILYPVELVRQLNIPIMLLTNAAGGINPTFKPGDIMLLSDHLNLSGLSPLRGALHEGWGDRFPDMTAVYDGALREVLKGEGAQWLHEGVYAFSTGPAYETPAEIRAWQTLGADAIGMSTVLEATLAHACGIRLAAVSCVTNAAAGISSVPLSHAEVLEASIAAKPRMTQLLERFISVL